MLPAEARKENQERAGDGSCSPGISVRTRTRIYFFQFLPLDFDLWSYFPAGPAGVDHPNTGLLAGVLVFQRLFQSHIMVEDLWCFP